MKKKVLHIGCGLVGSLIAENLAKDYDVTVADVSAERLSSLKKQIPNISTVTLSGNSADLTELAESGYSIATGAVTGLYALQNAKAVLKAGVSFCDISSFGPQDDMNILDKTAKENSCFYIPEIGIAPGMTNFIAGRGAALLDEVENIKIYVGGFPENPKPPFNYQATWSPADVIQEYYSQVRVVRDGKFKMLRAVEELHEIDFEPLGKLEAFVTDGLGTLVDTIKAKNMSEMTTRWPGHAAQMLLLRDMGLFEENIVNLGGVDLVPRKVLSDILLPMWKMDPEKGDRDLLAWRVIVDGKKGEEYVTLTWEMLTRYDEKTQRTAMSRSTGLTCATFARAALAGKISAVGVTPPELLATDDSLYKFIMVEQSKLGFNYHEKIIKEQDIVY